MTNEQLEQIYINYYIKITIQTNGNQFNTSIKRQIENIHSPEIMEHI